MLGFSLAPTVGTVLAQSENTDGDTVDEETFTKPCEAAAPPDRRSMRSRPLVPPASDPGGG